MAAGDARPRRIASDRRKTGRIRAVNLPSGVLIELTSRCNLTCRMCPLTAGDTPSSHDPGNIDPAVWQQVSAFAGRVGRANVGGYGEPLSNQKCLGYLRELDAAGVRISLTTNATMVNEKIAAELAAMRNLVNINVSLDSPDPAVYQDIRGGDLAHALRGVGLLARAMGSNRLTVSSVLMRSNVRSLTTFPARLKELGVGAFVLQGLVDYTAGLEHEYIGWDHGLSEAVEAIRAAASESGIRLVLELPYRTTTTNDVHVEAAATPSPDDARQCFAPWEEPVVDKDGRVFPCCYAMTHGKAVLGNLKEETFEAVWHGRSYTDFRRAIVDGRTTPDICRQCTVVPSGPHLYREYAAAPVPEASQLSGGGPFRVVMRNLGTATWTRADQIHIGTTGPRDRASDIRHPLWMGHNRVGSFAETEVPAGGLATFEIPVKPLGAPAVESFQLVVEHRAWLPGTGFTLMAEAKRMADRTTSPLRKLLRKVFSVLGAAVLVFAIAGVADLPASQAPRSGNPVFEGWYADPEVRVFEQQYWIYPTYSAPYGQQVFMDAFSSTDLVTWTKHPRVLDVASVKWATRALWAPTIVFRDGWYYLFFSANDIQNDQQPGGIGIARARKPGGPFEDYLGKPLVDKFYNGAQPIDPFVFQDQDGSFYLIYGGWRHCNIAKLNADFTGFVPHADGSTFKEITPEGYVEGSFMFVKDGKYYFMWSEGGWTGPNYAVAYAIGTSPLGPFQRAGKILQQDPAVATGAGHHSVLRSPRSGQWYIVYHRRPLGQTDRNSRVVCIDEMKFDSSGAILPVVITREGVARDPVK